MKELERNGAAPQASAARGQADGPYADIIGLEHPVSRKHPPMPASDRAAQFSPFAALVGFEDVIDDVVEENWHLRD